MAAGYFDAVIEQCKQIIAKSETDPPADIALYALGEVYANNTFAGKDYGLAQYYFEKLVANFPDSNLVPEAKIFISLLETIAAREQAVALIEKTNEGKKKISVSTIESHKLIENNDFEGAVEKNLLLVEEFGRKKPADEALYNLGLIYAHYDNPAKDYQQSQLYFNQLTEQFPDSDYVEEAQIWLGLFETIEKMQQIDKEIEQQKKQLNQ